MLEASDATLRHLPRRAPLHSRRQPAGPLLTLRRTLGRWGALAIVALWLLLGFVVALVLVRHLG